jgi:hypothetical protein
MKKNKIIEDNILFEDDEDDENGNIEDEFYEEDEDIEEGSWDELRGPNGEIYPSTSSGEELVEDDQGRLNPKRLFVPRCKVHAYRLADG